MADASETRFAYIDALRGYAILLVILVHASQRAGGMQPFIYAIADQGARGVQLFFVASAITLCMSWQRKHDGLLAFYVRRFFRIAPMFWLAIVFFTLVDGLGPRGLEPDGIGLKHIMLTAAFSHGFLPSTFSSVVPGGWSIAVEMMFYAIFPALISLIVSWRSAAIAAGLSLVPAAISYWLWQSAAGVAHPASWGVIYQVYSTLNIIHQIPVFLIGMTAYFVIRDEQSAIERRPFLLAGISLLPVAIVMVAFHRFQIQWAEFGFHSSFGLAFAGFAIALSWQRESIFVRPWIIFVGKVSFSAYLWHLFFYTRIPASYSWLSPIAGFAFYYAILTSVTLLASSMTYKIIEKPMVRMGGRILAALSQKRGSAEAVANTL